MKNRTDTELSKEYWRLKELKAQPQAQFYPISKVVWNIFICRKHGIIGKKILLIDLSILKKQDSHEWIPPM